MNPSSDSVTQLLIDWSRGDKAALDKLMPLVYDELHRLASHYLRHERSDHTLQPTALVHEAYLRLVDQTSVHWQDRAHFFGMAATLMRHILVDYARHQQRAKRGGSTRTLALERAPSERTAFLDAACAGDTSLRGEVERLLASDAEAGGFLEASAVDVARAVLPDRPVEPLVDRRIGAYTIVREIGHGGMGAVYLAVRADDQYQKQVAIKLVKRGMDTDSLLRRFRNEQQILANLDHPNIAKLLDGGTTEDGLSYFIMDYVDGQPIDAYCDSQKLSTVERLKLFRTICSAVHYAHQNLVVHRDLKPSNILVTTDGVAKLLDFGIAKLLTPERSAQAMESTVAARLMTPEYASPEQVRGGPITTASDVYSLGVLLYELLTSHRPYRLTSLTPQEVERVICESEPEKPSAIIGRTEEPGRDGHTPESVSARRQAQPGELGRQLRGDLDNIALMAMRKEPPRRYASVEQLSEDIGRHLEGRPVFAHKDTLGYRSAKFVKRNKAGVLAVTLMVLTLVAGLIATIWQAHRAEQQRMRAEQQELKNRRLLYVAQMNLAYQDWENANIGRLRTLLEGQRPQPGQEDLRGFEWHYLWRLSHMERFTLPHASVVRSVAFSPDGQRLATGSEDRTVKLWNVATRQEVATLTGHTGWVSSVAFSPDGQRLATGSSDQTVKLWEVATRQEVATLKGHTSEVSSVAFSPDGQRLATGSLNQTVKLWDVARRQEIATLKGHTGWVYSVAFSLDGQRLASGSADQTVKLWDVARRQEVTTLKGHAGAVSSVAFSPDGQRLASGSLDQTVKLWDVARRQEVPTLQGHAGVVRSVAFSPDGQQLASGSQDRTVKLWETTPKPE